MSQRFLDWKPVALLIRLSRKIILPGFDGLPLYNVLGFFLRGLQQGYIATRASAISFSFFIAFFPFLIFLFSIIPFIPIANFQQVLLNQVQEFIPEMAWSMVKETIIDIITRPRSGVLILNFLLALYFSTRGIKSLIETFNNTYHDIESRSTVKQYLVSLILVIIITFLLIIAISMMTFGFRLLILVLPDFIVKAHFFLFLLQLLRWLITLSALQFHSYTGLLRHEVTVSDLFRQVRHCQPCLLSSRRRDLIFMSITFPVIMHCTAPLAHFWS
jgi:membrane protein